MRDAHRAVAARCLRHLELQQPERHLPAPAEPVADDHAVGVLGADGLDDRPADLDVGLRIDAGGLVEQVEAEPLGRHVAVAPGEGLPVHAADALRVGVGPEALGFSRRGDRVARRAVEVHHHVDAVLLAEDQRLVDLRQHVLVDLLPVAIDDPAAVVHRQPHEVETQLVDHAEVVLAEAARPRLLELL